MDFKNFDQAMKNNNVVRGICGSMLIEVMNLRGHSCIIRMIIKSADSFIYNTTEETQMKSFQMIESNPNFNWSVEDGK